MRATRYLREHLSIPPTHAGALHPDEPCVGTHLTSTSALRCVLPYVAANVLSPRFVSGTKGDMR